MFIRFLSGMPANMQKARSLKQAGNSIRLTADDSCSLLALETNT